jgi:phosphohistidine phosphatase
MKLILFRHGVALDRDEAEKMKISEELRPLIGIGRKKTEKVAKALLEIEPEIDMLVTSPLVRALETAKIASKILLQRNIHQCPELIPSAPPMAFSNWLKANAGTAKCLVAFGHEPHLSVLGSWLLAGTTTSFIDLKKSGVLCLELESFDEVGPKSATLKYLLTPKLT